MITMNGSQMRVEEKYNFTDRTYDQLIVELLQDVKTGDLGWFYHVDCERLMWMYCPETRADPPRIIYSIKWQQFKPHVLSLIESDGWHRCNICPKGYGLTLNYPVKWQPLLDMGIAMCFEYADIIAQMELL